MKHISTPDSPLVRRKKMVDILRKTLAWSYEKEYKIQNKLIFSNEIFQWPNILSNLCILSCVYEKVT